MSIIQVVGTGTSSLSDRSSFIGQRVPSEVSAMTKLLNKIKDPRQVCRKLVQGHIAHLEGRPALGTPKLDLEPEQVDVISSGLYTVIRAALRLPLGNLKKQDFQADLKELKFPTEVIEDLTNILYGPKQEKLSAASLVSKPQLPKLEEFKWRADVAISTSSLSRVLEPYVTMQMKLSTGKTATFRVPLSRFHALRHGVAHVLREMEQLEQTYVMRLPD